MTMNPQMLGAAYLAAGALFILSLNGLSNQESARRGNMFGIIGMIIAVGATILSGNVGNFQILFPAMIVGGIIGTIVMGYVIPTGSREEIDRECAQEN